MNLLAFDTSTETLSVAVSRAGTLAAQRTEAGSALASAVLIPALQALLAQAGLSLRELDAIVFGRGPGSFTGLRTACAVAQGLGFGARVPVLGIDTLLAIAEEARVQAGADRVVAVLDARMGEVYTARYLHDGAVWRRDGDIALLRPQAVDVPAGWVLAGNACAAFAEQPGAATVAAMPTAGAMLRIAPQAIASGEAHDAALAMPVYIRDKVAQTTEERAAARAPASAP